MKKILDVTYLSFPITPRHEPIAMCIGYFDGVHLGHQQLIEKTVTIAKRKGLKPCLFTFDPSPAMFLKKSEQEGLLTPLHDREELVAQYGIKEVIILPFNHDVSSMSAEEFFDKVIEPLHVQELVCGFDFRYARKGEGSIDTLSKKESSFFHLHVVEEVKDEYGKISSSKIISFLHQGNIEVANSMLGRPYRIQGTVVHGLGNGHKIGFPTANIATSSYIIPLRGVYAVVVELRGKQYLGMANIGYHPTIQEVDSIQLEVHLFNFQDDIYGEKITILFLSYLRGEQKFSSIEELKRQLHQDREQIMNCKNIRFPL